MMAEDQHMDDVFRKASNEVKFPYQAAFWKEVESQLADDSLDHAFKAAAVKVAAVPHFELPADLNMDDAFLDDAFKSAGETVAVSYKPEFWEQFQANLSVIQQDEAFTAASNTVIADYRPHYWDAADVALQEEGLHYEYKKDYWNEARVLLDLADRRIFFLKWAGVAGILLLLSVAGVYHMGDNSFAPPALAQHAQQDHTSSLAVNADVFVTTQLMAGVNEKNSSLIPAPGVDAISNANRNEPAFGESVNNDQGAERDMVITGDRDSENSSNKNTDGNKPVTGTVSGDVTSTGNEQITSTGSTDGVTIAVNTNVPQDTESNSSQQSEQGIPVLNDADPTQFSTTGQGNQSSKADVMGSIHWLSFNNAIEPLNSDAQSTFAGTTVDEETKNLHPINKNAVTVPAYDGTEIEIDTKTFLTPTHTVSFFGLAGIGNKYGAPELTPSWRTNFGFEYLNTSFGRLRNFEFGGSLSMSHVRQNDFGTERRVSVFNLEGGVDKLWYKLQLKDMMYANATATVAYRITSKQKVRLSVSYDHLVFVQSNMSYQKEPDRGITTVNNNWGVKSGLNVSDVRLGLGYEVQLGNRFSVLVNGSYGFMDRTDNAFMMNDITDHELNVTAGFKYTLFRKL
jgi:hypothetical protein